MSAKTVARLLKDHGYSLRANVKMLEGKQHPDRHGQFRYINTEVSAFLASGQPVISVDRKKRSWWATTRPVAGSSNAPGPGGGGHLRLRRRGRQGVSMAMRRSPTGCSTCPATSAG